jgi:hypothetical protein
MNPSVSDAPTLNILILYRAVESPPRKSVEDHLYSFRRYSGHRCFYVNLAVRALPWYLKSLRFDLVIFHTSFLSTRWHRGDFLRLLEQVSVLRSLAVPKIALPQDEFIQTDLVCEFINDFEIDHVFSVAPPSEWPKIYHAVNFDRVQFHYVLTGYLDEETVGRIQALAQTVPDRPIDVGYRAWRAEPWLGRHGFLKTQIAEVFQQAAPERGMAVDISTDSKATFLGDEWFKFMLRCRYTIGVEGGATILDRDGSIQKKTNEYTQDHPQADFEEVEAACFPGEDGYLQLLAISPRHLEACATRTGQVLIEGEYNGILEPDKHYIELKRDFSNLNEVLDLLKREDLRKRLVEQAYQDVVASGKYTYEQFARDVIATALEGRSVSQAAVSPLHRLRASAVHRWTQRADAGSWKRMAFAITMRKRVRRWLELVIPKEKVSEWNQARVARKIKKAEG